MVIDTSAVLAILFGEPEARKLAQAIEDASVRRLSAATLLEASIVIERATASRAVPYLTGSWRLPKYRLSPLLQSKLQSPE